MHSRDELFLRSLECYFGVYQNNPLVSAETVRHSSTYIILCIHARISMLWVDRYPLRRKRWITTDLSQRMCAVIWRFVDMESGHIYSTDLEIELRYVWSGLVHKIYKTIRDSYVKAHKNYNAWHPCQKGNFQVPNINAIQWRHNGHDSVSNHKPHEFTQPFIQTQIKESIKLCVTGLCAGNSPVIGEFPAQMASNTENVSIWWRHHVISCCCQHGFNSMQAFI